ncbi:MAG: PQQ-binding-like beta-propeller repeat protein [Verrucomicrobia bacterium]|nr:PQQ-binding-like beta-propeller repeat protein [Verrucomicrobiota bacterium]
MQGRIPAGRPALARLVAVWTSLLVGAVESRGSAADRDWSVYLGNQRRSSYSPLDQINRDNVSRLERAWTYDTREKAPYQTNNLVIGGVLYTVSPATRKVIALDAASGRELWVWGGPKQGEAGGTAGAARQSRGVVYWENEEGGEQRLFSAVGNYLYGLDPKTGGVIRSFGDEGAAHLGKGLDGMETAAVNYNTPGVIYKDLLIFGVSSGSPRGIRAMDVRTGEIRWQFHTAPRPGEFGYDTWPEGYDRNGISANDWSGQALDVVRGIVYASTKTAAPDFLGAARHGQNLFANSLIALDARTGKRLWHFQIVHHDLLDRDLPCAPVLLTVNHGGRKVDAVAQGTKHGLLFVFDRMTGEPLWPIEERRVPQTDLEGEQSWPTQPFPTKPAPLMRQYYTEADVSTISPEAQALTLARIRLSPNFGPFPAPSLRESVMFPGYNGGMEWGGGAADPEGIYYVNINEIPWFLQMVETRRADGTALAHGEYDYRALCAACHGLDRSGNPHIGFPSLIEIDQRRTRAEIERILVQGAGMMPPFDRVRENQRRAVIDFLLGQAPVLERQEKTPSATSTRAYPRYTFAGFRKFVDRQGYPGIKPPWGTLSAVDLNAGEIKWQVPLGEYPELSARGIPPTGTENYGGPVVTAGGLVFIAATADQMIRAFDKDTGKILWKARLPFGGNATPSTYMVNGRQYVVISAGGSRWGGPVGGSVVAFALPKPPVSP